MGIKYKKLLSEKRNYKLDKELLMEMEYNDILFLISKSFVEYRDKNNLTQMDLAKKLNVKQAMISKIESGKYNPSIKFLVYIWNILSDDNNNFAFNLLSKMNEKVNKNYEYIKENQKDILKTKNDIQNNNILKSQFNNKKMKIINQEA